MDAQNGAGMWVLAITDRLLLMKPVVIAAKRIPFVVMTPIGWMMETKRVRGTWKVNQPVSNETISFGVKRRTSI